MRKKIKQSGSNIPEEKILQISNDISEGMCTAKREDIMAVASYWADKAFQASTSLSLIKAELAISKLRL